jgi:hypothetical protein
MHRRLGDNPPPPPHPHAPAVRDPRPPTTGHDHDHDHDHDDDPRPAPTRRPGAGATSDEPRRLRSQQLARSQKPGAFSSSQFPEHNGRLAPTKGPSLLNQRLAAGGWGPPTPTPTPTGGLGRPGGPGSPTHDPPGHAKSGCALGNKSPAGRSAGGCQVMGAGGHPPGQGYDWV